MFLQGFFALVSLFVLGAHGRVSSYQLPDIYKKSNTFELQVDGRQAHTVNYARYDYAHLSMHEGRPIEFRLKPLTGEDITSWSITPRKLDIDAKVDGGELVFSITQAHYLIIKINNLKEFVLLVDPPERNAPKPWGRRIFNVWSYDADPTGLTVTKGIQKAVDAASRHPGSTVYVPPGLYNIGNLVLRHKTSLYLAGGAVLRFTGNPDDYETMYTKSDLGPGTWWIRTEADSSDIKVFGRGILDANGYETRKNNFMSSALVPAGTKNFRADGILTRDSSFWAVTPIQSEDVTLTNLKILNRFDVTQDDGIDVCESKNVVVRRAIAIANDDSFSAKTWPYKTGTTVPYPYPPQTQSDVVFEDCLAWTLCFGYKVGQGVHQDQDRVTFQNSVAYSAGVGMGIHHLFGNSTARDIKFENIDIERLHGAPGGFASWLVIIIREGGRDVGPIDGVQVKNIRAREIGERQGYIEGYSADVKVHDVTLSDIFVHDSTTPATTLKEMKIYHTNYSEDITIKNSVFKASSKPDLS